MPPPNSFMNLTGLEEQYSTGVWIRFALIVF